MNEKRNAEVIDITSSQRFLFLLCDELENRSEFVYLMQGKETYKKRDLVWVFCEETLHFLT